jgi:hypothetical protein
VEPANAKVADFLGFCTKDEKVVITLSLALAESGCHKPWAAVFVQQDQEMVLTGRSDLELPDERVLMSALWNALRWEHQR